jgi:hypothetical protein
MVSVMRILREDEQNIGMDAAWEAYCKREMRKAFKIMKLTLEKDELDCLRMWTSCFQYFQEALHDRPWCQVFGA